jgi:K+-sensing histidine kinase KdpD
MGFGQPDPRARQNSTVHRDVPLDVGANLDDILMSSLTSRSAGADLCSVVTALPSTPVAGPNTGWWPYVAAVALVVLTTGVSWVVHRVYAVPDLEALYFLTIMLTAVRYGRGPSILASFLAVAAYDFFFVVPHLTFAVADVRYLLTFALMFAIGIVISELTARIREQEFERMRLLEESRASELRARTEELRAALLSAVSHDLRTPLAAITGVTSTLRDDAVLDPVTRKELLDTLAEEADRLERLVTNLLEMSRLQSGEIHLTREWMPLEEIVGSALTRLESRLGRRPIQVDLGGVPLVSVDPVLFERVLANLLENATKYTSPDAAIEVRAHSEPSGVVVDVADRGPGLEPGTERLVFEKFYRGVHPGTGGVGLGLAICRAIVEAHGGAIEAQNRTGGGAVFRICLPSTGAPPTAAEVPS